MTRLTSMPWWREWKARGTSLRAQAEASVIERDPSARGGLAIRTFSCAAAALASLFAVAGCSSSGGAKAAGPAPIVVNDERDAVLSAALGERVISNDQAIFESVAAKPEQVYQALIVAYSELSVPATVINPRDGLVASLNRRAYGRLGNERLSRYVSCGDSMTGPRADQDRITLSIISWAKPDGTGRTRIETRVVGNASDSGGTSVKMPCTTTGELESRVHKAAKAALGL
jgi:hypothetical protein